MRSRVVKIILEVSSYGISYGKSRSRYILKENRQEGLQVMDKLNKKTTWTSICLGSEEIIGDCQ